MSDTEESSEVASQLERMRKHSTGAQDAESQLRAEIEKEDAEIEALRAKAEERRKRQEEDARRQEEEKARIEAEKRQREASFFFLISILSLF